MNPFSRCSEFRRKRIWSLLFRHLVSSFSTFEWKIDFFFFFLIIRITAYPRWPRLGSVGIFVRSEEKARRCKSCRMNTNIQRIYQHLARFNFGTIRHCRKSLVPRRFRIFIKCLYTYYYALVFIMSWLMKSLSIDM